MDGKKILVGDVTAYGVKGEVHYLATLMRIPSRETVGFAVSNANNTELVKSALLMAKESQGDLKGYIHHTDSDVRYCSKEYTSLMNKYEMTISMCVGNAYENAESLNSTIKRQETNANEYKSGEHSFQSIMSFFEKYNSLRPPTLLWQG